MDPQLAKVKTELREVRKAYIDELPSHLEKINHVWEDLQEAEDPKILLGVLMDLIHSMSGSGGMFGLHRLSECAQKIELVLQDVTQGSQPIDIQYIEGLMEQLRQALTLDESQELLKQDEKTILIVSGDADHSNVMALQLGLFGYHTVVMSEMDKLESTMAESLPDVLLLDMVDDKTMDALLKIKKNQGWHLPVACISATDHFDLRLKVAKSGGETFLVNPEEINPLIGRLDEWTKEPDQTPYRVLVVAINEKLAAHYSLQLKNAGIDAMHCSQVDQVIHTISKFSPELLVVDENLTVCDGLEMVKVIRQEEAYRHIPAVFLSSTKNLERKFLDLRMGGDDFLTKPIDDVEFADSIKIRTERARSKNAFMTRDPLTGCINQSTLVEQVDKELSRSRRLKSKMAFVLVNIQGLQSINEKYGHISGDRVIKTLTRMFDQRIRKSDNLGRYSGSELAIILSECSRYEAEKVILKIHERFTQLVFQHEKQVFSADFQAAILDNEFNSSASSLLGTAERLIDQAKRENKSIVLYENEL